MNLKNRKRIIHSTYGEVMTANNQLLSFSCHPDNKEEVKEFISTKIRHIDIPTTGRVNVLHGAKGRYTRYDITQHKYAGGGPGYVEVLEIKDYPDQRVPFIIYEYTCTGDSHFTEWDSLSDAINAFKRYWNSGKGIEILPSLPGFIRKVNCGLLCPWFYAIGDEILVGDYAFPEGLQDDPFFRFGAKFVVSDCNGIPSIKTCMGTRFIEGEIDGHSNKVETYRLVYFSDGTIWDERHTYPQWSSKGEYQLPRLVKDEEMWVVEAIKQFQKLLTGDIDVFTINFTGGDKFVGKFVKRNTSFECTEGNYKLAVNLKGDQLIEGRVSDFVPTAECPDIVSYVTAGYAKQGKEVERIQIKEKKLKGKKWSGVYYKR